MPAVREGIGLPRPARSGGRQQPAAGWTSTISARPSRSPGPPGRRHVSWPGREPHGFQDLDSGSRGRWGRSGPAQAVKPQPQRVQRRTSGVLRRFISATDHCAARFPVSRPSRKRMHLGGRCRAQWWQGPRRRRDQPSRAAFRAQRPSYGPRHGDPGRGPCVLENCFGSIPASVSTAVTGRGRRAMRGRQGRPGPRADVQERCPAGPGAAPGPPGRTGRTGGSRPAGPRGGPKTLTRQHPRRLGDRPR